MARFITITPNKTYATVANAVKAVHKVFPDTSAGDGLTYFIMPTSDGRFFPVFPGDRAIQAGVHHHFNVVG
jgi:hypothetical protein